MMPQAAKVTQSWRDLYPPHPCADVFPMMSEAELDDLANDIKAHGLLKRVVLTQGDPDEDDDKVYVLDGRNRLEALTRLGVEFPVPAKHWEPVVIGKDAREAFIVFEWRAGQIDIDPAAYVIGANIKRRHLTKEQQAELIVKTIEAGQATNDRATVARSFNPTNGQKGGSTKDPVLAKAVTEAAKHGISKRTVQTARAKLQDKPTPASVSKVPRAPRSTPTSQPADPALSEMTRLLAAKAGLPRLLDTPSDEWPALLRTLRTYCVVDIVHDCRQLLVFIHDVQECLRAFRSRPLGQKTFLRYKTVNEVLRHELHLDPKLVEWAERGLKLLQVDASHGHP